MGFHLSTMAGESLKLMSLLEAVFEHRSFKKNTPRDRKANAQV